MENRELKRVFDQVKLSPERQEAMLERLLSGERSGKTVKPMKRWWQYWWLRRCC